MPHYDYGFNQKGKEENIAKAQQYNIDASFKDLSAVCANIKGMTQDEGKEYLEAVLNGFPVLYKRWNKRLGHRKELGGQRGRYPVKAAKFVLMVLNNAIANADVKGILDPVIAHASANKQSSYPRLQPKGRQSRADYVTSRVEIVLLGKAAEKKPEAAKKPKTDAKPVEKKAEAKPTETKEVKKEEKPAEKKAEAKPAEKKVEKKEEKPAEKKEVKEKPKEEKKEVKAEPKKEEKKKE